MATGPRESRAHRMSYVWVAGLVQLLCRDPREDLV